MGKKRMYGVIQALRIWVYRPSTYRSPVGVHWVLLALIKVARMDM